MTTVLLSVGDASGDAHAAELALALRRLRPDLRCVGLGGVCMEKAGVELVAHQRELAVGGLVELLPSAGRIWRTWRRMGRALESRRPDLAVLVDASGFNLPLARLARRAGVPTLYYVAPQVWAWRRGRLRKLARRIDRVAAILPFEVDLYRQAGVRADFVGHPLVDRVATAPDRQDARAALGLGPGPVVALLPGSRRNELRHNLGLFLEAARALHAQERDVAFLLPVPDSLDRAAVAGLVHRAALPAALRLELVAGGSLQALAASDAVLAKPGTGTLEAALLGRPLVVAARVHPLTAALLRRLLGIDFLAMPNLILARRVVPELLQREARPPAMAAALHDLLRGPARERQLQVLADLRGELGRDAAVRAAGIALEMLDAGRAA
jgi:lipid-A-disaccharide synthase